MKTESMPEIVDLVERQSLKIARLLEQNKQLRLQYESAIRKNAQLQKEMRTMENRVIRALRGIKDE